MSFRLRLRFLVTFVFATAVPGSLPGVTLTLSATGSGALVTPEGAPLAAGSVVRVGTFDNFGVASDPMATFTDLYNAFHPLGEGVGVVNQVGAPDPNGMLVVNEPAGQGSAFGLIEGIGTAGAPPHPVFVSGVTSLVLWVFDTTDPSKLAETNGRWGIFGATGSVLGWIYFTTEENAPFLDAGGLKAGMIDNLIAYRGGRDPLSGKLQLAPEPSAAVMGLVAALLAAARMRSRGRP